MIIRHKAVVQQPRIKRDKTGMVSFGTLLELTKEQFDELNDTYYNGTEVFLFVVGEDDLVDFVKELGEDLLNNK